MSQSFGKGVLAGLLLATACVGLGTILGVIEVPKDASDRAPSASIESRPESPRTPSDTATLRGAVEPRMRELAQALAASQARVAELEAHARASGAGGADTEAGEAMPGEKNERPEVSEAARREAESLGVSPGALDAAWKALSEFYGASAEQREELAAAVRAHGEEGFHALVALLRDGGHGHIVIPEIVEAVKVPGGEALLIETMESYEGRPGFAAWSAMRSIGRFDTGRARDYLVQRLEGEEDPGLYMSAAQALGDLAEPRGGDVIRVELLAQPVWSGVRRHIFHAMGRMGGAGAIRALEEYLALPHADALAEALSALHELAPESARRHARRILASDREPFISIYDRSTIERIAAEDD